MTQSDDDFRATTLLRKIEICTAALLIAGSFIFLWGRAKFGVEFLDELYFLIPGFHTLGAGDRPLVDEFQNANRHQDLLNYFLVRPWIPYSVLALRRAALSLYAILLLVLSGVCFRKKWGLAAALAVSGCLVYDAFQLPCWSYNWWCRDFLLLLTTLLWAATRAGNVTLRRSLLYLAGIAGAGAVLSYHPIMVAWGAACAVLAGILFFKRRILTQLPEMAALLGGTATLLLPDFIYLMSEPVKHKWLYSVWTMSQLRDFHSGAKLGSIARYLFGLREAWALVIAGGVILFTEQRILSRSVKYLSYAVYGVAVSYLGKRLFFSEISFLSTQAMVALGWVAGLWTLVNARRVGEWVTVAAVTSLAASCGMALVSVTDTAALSWAMPALIVPGYFLWLWRNSEGHFLKGLPVTILILVLWVASVRWQREHVYFDVRPADASATLTMPPLAGIRTSPRRAFLVRQIYEVVKNKKYALAYPDITLPFLWTRSAVDTINLNGSYPDWVQRDRLKFMLEYRRFPEVILEVKQHYWDWGGSDDPPQRLNGTGDSVVKRFARCTAHRKIVSYAEFDAYAVDSSRVVACANHELSSINP